MKLFIVLLLVALTGCGKDTKTIQTQSIVEVNKPDYFSGFYAMPDGGYLEIVRDSGGLYDLNQVRLIVTNADGSKGLLPLGAISNLPETNGSLFQYGNLNYTAVNNVKVDNTWNVLNGSLFTMNTFSNVNGVLTVRVQISNGATVVFDHSITAQ